MNLGVRFGTFLSLADLRSKNSIETRGCSTDISNYSTKKWMLWITRYLIKMSLAQIKNKIR